MVLILMLTVAIRSRRRHPWLTFGLIWPLVAMLPTHSLIARLDPIAEGPLYLAAVGPAISVGYYAARWLHNSHRKAGIVLGTMLLCASALCVWRTSVWGSQVQLWQEATVRAPQSARAWTNLGMAYTSAGDAAAARAAYLRSLQLDPANVRAMINLETLAAIADTHSAALMSSGITP
jgi:protein O-mannosyl-transferase